VRGIIGRSRGGRSACCSSSDCLGSFEVKSNRLQYSSISPRGYIVNHVLQGLQKPSPKPRRDIRLEVECEKRNHTATEELTR
jgi:hypothetical protein